MDRLKLIPLALLALFGAKGLILGVSYVDAAILVGLGVVGFLYEKNLDKEHIKALKEENSLRKQEIEALKKEVEHAKAFITSFRMNNLRVGQK